MQRASFGRVNRIALKRPSQTESLNMTCVWMMTLAQNFPSPYRAPFGQVPDACQLSNNVSWDPSLRVNPKIIPSPNFLNLERPHRSRTSSRV